MHGADFDGFAPRGGLIAGPTLHTLNEGEHLPPRLGRGREAHTFTSGRCDVVHTFGIYLR